MNATSTRFIHPNIGVAESGRLSFAGADVVALAERFGTPLMIFDEDLIRERMREYIALCRREFGGTSAPLYASKALSLLHIYRIAAEEGMRIDCVSPWEIEIAAKAGFPVENAYFHGNCKTDADLRAALDLGVGYIVADSREELIALNVLCGERGVRQKVLLRVTPGIDPHTHAKISTGQVDSKFGVPIETGQALELVRLALSLENIELRGYHCHVGSQVFTPDVFLDAASIMLGFSADVRDALGFEAATLDLGGGIGVRYVEDDPQLDRAAILAAIGEKIREVCAGRSLAVPEILIEPGRSIVADAGMTVYTVGSVKEIPGFRTYVSIDGGMTDNPRYTLYGSKYTIYNADRPEDEADLVCTLAGRCCESGDLIAEGIALARPERGDHVAVAVTGAYNHSMSSNYNRVPRPAAVFVSGGEVVAEVRRESVDDMTATEIC